ncbi:hypothetical protein [Sphingobacterium multivorum]|uniref:hypothetical protein n=1 Tax=Sphingobacterium multivorum TaxID=28454 RepID=UPI0036C52FAD
MRRRNGPTAGKTSPADWESGPKGSDRVGLAGKGNAKAGTWKAPRKSDPKDLIESETQDRREAPGGKPERVSTKEASVP